MSPETEQKPREVRSAVVHATAPGWVLALYLGGLALVYAGEHVLSGFEKWPAGVTALGTLGVLLATLLRLSPRFRAGGDRKSIESTLAVLSGVGVLALLLYFLTTPWGVEHLFLGKLSSAARDRATDVLTVSWIALIVVSTLPMIFIETAMRPMRTSERPESRRVRAAAGAGLTLALAAVYGALFVYAASGVKLDVDFSYFKTSRPSESTRKLAQSLKDPVRVVAFFPQVSEVREQVQRYLDELKPSTPKLRIEVHDRLLWPKLAKEMRATQDGVIVLSRGGTTQTIVVGTDFDTAKAKLKVLDRDFQEQLTKLAVSRRTAYLTVGHGELNESRNAGTEDPSARSATVVRTLLQRQNYFVKDLGLAQGLARDVPDDADVVLVLGPTEPFSKEELASLQRYLARNGKLYMALDDDAISSQDIVTAAPGASAAPAESAGKKPAAGAPPEPASSAHVVDLNAVPEGPLQDLTRLVGLTYGTDVLANEHMHVRLRHDDSDRTRLVTQTFSSHASVSTLSRAGGRAAVVLFGAGSLEKARGASEHVDFTLRSPPGTFADANRNYQLDRPSERQITFNIAAAVTGGDKSKTPAAKGGDEKNGKKKDDEKSKSEPDEMRAFVLSDADALSDFLMVQDPYNQVLFVDSLRWLVGEESIAGPPNTEEDQRIQHTKQQDLTWFYATIFGAPGLVLGLGVALSRRSRRGKGSRQ